MRLGGYLARQLSPFQLVVGRIGRGTKLPPQLGQTLPSSVSTHVEQNVHSKLQMRASGDAGGSGLLQCSQVGRSSSTMTLPSQQLLLYSKLLVERTLTRRYLPTGRAERNAHTHRLPVTNTASHEIHIGTA